MSTEPIADAEPAAAPPSAVAENAYLTIGLAAIIVIGVALLQGGTNRWAVVPTLIGAAGLAFRWRSAPLVLLAAVAFTQLFPLWMMGESFAALRSPPLAVELSLCGAVLAYMMAQYRLFGLTATVFPPDARRPQDELPPRNASRAPVLEVLTALVTIAAAAIGAFFLWSVVSAVPPVWGIRRSVWLAGLLAWLVAAALLLSASVIGYLGWRRLSCDEASLYLRDVLWHETRGEQRSIQRWRAWARRRRERKH